jgi:hypothetical protein
VSASAWNRRGQRGQGEMRLHGPYCLYLHRLASISGLISGLQAIPYPAAPVS